jgi:prolyl oligopeptidase
MTAKNGLSRRPKVASARVDATRRAFLAGGIASGVVIATGSARPQPIAGDIMPPAPQDSTVDVLHGVTVPDPFRPLEDSARADARAWVAAQDRQARA